MSEADISISSIITAVIKKDITEIIALLDDLRLSLKRMAALISATVIHPRAQTLFQWMIFYLPMPAAL